VVDRMNLPRVQLQFLNAGLSKASVIKLGEMMVIQIRLTTSVMAQLCRDHCYSMKMPSTAPSPQLRTSNRSLVVNHVIAVIPLSRRLRSVDGFRM
jgi:hypothetical protein